MSRDGVESQTPTRVFPVVHEFRARLIQPALEAMIEGRHRFGLSDTDILNQALQLWIWIIQASDDSDILVRDRATGELKSLIAVANGKQLFPPAV